MLWAIRLLTPSCLDFLLYLARFSSTPLAFALLSILFLLCFFSNPNPKSGLLFCCNKVTQRSFLCGRQASRHPLYLPGFDSILLSWSILLVGFFHEPLVVLEIKSSCLEGLELATLQVKPCYSHHVGLLLGGKMWPAGSAPATGITTLLVTTPESLILVFKPHTPPTHSCGRHAQLYWH